MTYPKTCPHCGTAFNSQRPSAIYCTPACRTGAHRIRSGSVDAPTDYRVLADKATRAELKARRLRAMADKAKTKAKANKANSTPEIATP